MTARRRSRRTRHYPVLLAAGLMLALTLVPAVLHALGWLLVLGAVAAGAYLVGRNRHPAARAVTRSGPAPVQPITPAVTSADAESWTAGPAAQLAALMAERDQLAAHVADLERQLAEAEDIAHAAWDAAAHVPPRPGPGRDEDAIARLLADPLSGARPLGGAR